MPKIQFLGRVWPPGTGISIKRHPPLSAKVGDLFEMDVDIGINLGVVVVTCNIHHEPITDEIHRQVLLRVMDISHLVIDLMALSKGQRLAVQIDHVIDLDGKPKALLMENRNVRGLITAYTPDGNNIEPLVNKILEQPLALFAMRDLIESIGSSYASVINCARAVETIRNLVAGPGDRKQRWPIFNRSLNLGENYSKIITEAAHGPRHGDHSKHNDNPEIFTRSWIIMNRYFEYRLRNNQPLPPDEFPLLD